MTIRDLLVLKKCAGDRISQLVYKTTEIDNTLNNLYRELEVQQKLGDADPALLQEIEAEREKQKSYNKEISSLERAIEAILDQDI